MAATIREVCPDLLYPAHRRALCCSNVSLLQLPKGERVLLWKRLANEQTKRRLMTQRIARKTEEKHDKNNWQVYLKQNLTPTYYLNFLYFDRLPRNPNGFCTVQMCNLWTADPDSPSADLARTWVHSSPDLVLMFLVPSFTLAHRLKRSHLPKRTTRVSESHPHHALSRQPASSQTWPSGPTHHDPPDPGFHHDWNQGDSSCSTVWDPRDRISISLCPRAQPPSFYTSKSRWSSRWTWCTTAAPLCGTGRRTCNGRFGIWFEN